MLLVDIRLGAGLVLRHLWLLLLLRLLKLLLNDKLIELKLIHHTSILESQQAILESQQARIFAGLRDVER